ncbi:hypothetical protein KKH39_04295 [Patescibacteria group bacterium]|nr:hypothetical protein [Patescibacteria group bacterium]
METLEMKSQEINAQEQEKTFETINFHDIKGRFHEVVHPRILGEFSAIPRENDEVEVVLSAKNQTMTFGEYLQRIGVKYDWFFKTKKEEPDKNLQDLLRDLHQKSVDNRTAASIRQHQKFTHEGASYDNLQQETARNHSPVFTKIINDLGIDGLEAKEARPRQDYLDGIDEILEFDSTSLSTQGDEEGEKIIIGIQRSFSDKKRHITKDPIRFFPENPEAGAIFRVFIQEDLDDYIDKLSGMSYMQKLLEIRAQKARQAGQSPNQYAKSQRNDGLAPISQVLPKGEREQINRTLKVLKEIKEQMNIYIESDDFAGQTPFMQAEIKRKMELLDIDSFIGEIENLKAAA